MNKLFKNIYHNRRVFITGHTGFKGSWLAFWLRKMGAEVFGYSLEPPSDPNHASLLDLDIQSMIADIRDRDVLYGAIKDFQPEIVFHLAAQPLVRYSYQYPVDTFETNVMGCVFLFDVCRQVNSVRAIINVTSDKCYENKERMEGYREDDPMGGHDPYSCSKGCAELVTTAYRRSFFPIEEFGHSHHVLVASCRAGNVIGGGDWAQDRLIPDIIRAVACRECVRIRHPQAIRPWQHVLEPLSGYLLLGQRLLEGKKEFSQAWNFGPGKGDVRCVEDVVKGMSFQWDRVSYHFDEGEHLHEAKVLQLNCDKVNTIMNWSEVWDVDEAIRRTAIWYKKFYEEKAVVTENDISDYVNHARNKGIVWAV
ncbi:MAG: CDP-glucose 4,6-dehydratase [Candidatus Omnitrophota bacterium]